MNYLYPIGLLIISNIFMTFAWYGHLKLQQINVFTNNTPLYVVILASWLLALPEYACQVPANRFNLLPLIFKYPFNFMMEMVEHIPCYS